MKGIIVDFKKKICYDKWWRYKETYKEVKIYNLETQQHDIIKVNIGNEMYKHIAELHEILYDENGIKIIYEE